jgi:hypothetical protein
VGLVSGLLFYLLSGIATADCHSSWSLREKMEFPCGLCKRLSPRSVLERWGGFCSEGHKRDWLVVFIPPLFRDRQLLIVSPNSRENPP